MNSTNNNSFEIAAKKVFSDLFTLIKEDENKTDNKNVISNKIDDKPKQINLLDSSTDIKIDDKPKPFNLLDLDNDI